MIAQLRYYMQCSWAFNLLRRLLRTFWKLILSSWFDTKCYMPKSSIFIFKSAKQLKCGLCHFLCEQKVRINNEINQKEKKNQNSVMMATCSRQQFDKWKRFINHTLLLSTLYFMWLDVRCVSIDDKRFGDSAHGTPAHSWLLCIMRMKTDISVDRQIHRSIYAVIKPKLNVTNENDHNEMIRVPSRLANK